MKIKRRIVSAFILVSVLFTIASISVLAVDPIARKGNPETFSETYRGSRVVLGCYTNWTATSTTVSSHQSSFKYASCQSYTYTGSYQSQSHKSNTGTSSVVVTDNATVDGRTQKTEFIGFINNNAAIGSGIWGQEQLIIYRSDSPR